MKKGIVFNIQRYSLHDGGGIRTLVFLKGCPLTCEWCSNPESQATKPQLIFTQDKCMGCGKCVDICPTGARKGAEAHTAQCTLCGECVKVCPTGSLEIVGREMYAQEIIQEIEKDREFYETSNGGVTISGGEPLVQWEFTAELIKELKQRYYHVAIETCGYAQWEQVEKVVSLCDLILYDIKHMDSELHKKYIGVPNELILQNAGKIAQKNLNIVFRIPLLGGINDDENNITKVAKFAQRIGVKEVHLLPYHRFGEGKYKKLNREYTCKATTPSQERIDHLKQILESSGITVKVGG